MDSIEKVSQEVQQKVDSLLQKSRLNLQNYKTALKEWCKLTPEEKLNSKTKAIQPYDSHDYLTEALKLDCNNKEVMLEIAKYYADFGCEYYLKYEYYILAYVHGIDEAIDMLIEYEKDRTDEEDYEDDFAYIKEGGRVEGMLWLVNYYSKYEFEKMEKYLWMAVKEGNSEAKEMLFLYKKYEKLKKELKKDENNTQIMLEIAGLNDCIPFFITIMKRYYVMAYIHGVEEAIDILINKLRNGKSKMMEHKYIDDTSFDTDETYQYSTINQMKEIKRAGGRREAILWLVRDYGCNDKSKECIKYCKMGADEGCDTAKSILSGLIKPKKYL